VPNEHGTWFYGRGGWCDGAPVVPWVIDVGQALEVLGGTNHARYAGLFGGLDPDPDPSTAPGWIQMQAVLVWYA
jgi:hypothetical protein